MASGERGEGFEFADAESFIVAERAADVLGKEAAIGRMGRVSGAGMSARSCVSHCVVNDPSSFSASWDAESDKGRSDISVFE